MWPRASLRSRPELAGHFRRVTCCTAVCRAKSRMPWKFRARHICFLKWRHDKRRALSRRSVIWLLQRADRRSGTGFSACLPSRLSIIHAALWRHSAAARQPLAPEDRRYGRGCFEFARVSSKWRGVAFKDVPWWHGCLLYVGDLVKRRCQASGRMMHKRGPEPWLAVVICALSCARPMNLVAGLRMAGPRRIHDPGAVRHSSHRVIPDQTGCKPGCRLMAQASARCIAAGGVLPSQCRGELAAPCQR